MFLNIVYFIIDGKWVFKMLQGILMDEIILRNIDDMIVQVKNIGVLGFGYLYVFCIDIWDEQCIKMY